MDSSRLRRRLYAEAPSGRVCSLLEAQDTFQSGYAQPIFESRKLTPLEVGKWVRRALGRARPPRIEIAACSRASLYSCLAASPRIPGLDSGPCGRTCSLSSNLWPLPCGLVQLRILRASTFRDPGPWYAARRGRRGRGRGCCLLSQIRSLTAPSPVVCSLCTGSQNRASGQLRGTGSKAD